MNLMLLLPEGVGVRNFVLGKLASLASHEGTLSVLHTIPDDVLPTYQNSLDESVQWHSLFDLVDSPSSYTLRYVLNYAHMRWAKTSAHRAVLYAQHNKKKGSWRTRLADRTARIISQFMAFPRGIDWLGTLHQKAVKRLPVFKEYQKLLADIQPDIVFCSNQWSHSVIPVVLAAKSLGIPCATFIFSWDNITTRGHIPSPFDYFLVWSEHMKTELLRYYPKVNPEDVYIVGTPQFEPYADESLYVSKAAFFNQIGADPNRPLICYSGGIEGTCPEDQDHVSILMELIHSGQIKHSPQVLLRPAPTDNLSRFDEVRRKYPDMIYAVPEWVRGNHGFNTIPTSADIQFLVNLVRHADLNVNIASTMTLDFAIHDKPVVNIAFDVASPPLLGQSLWDLYYQFDHYRPVIELNAVRLAHSEQDLAKHVNSYLAQPLLEQEERHKLVDLEIGRPLGVSSEIILSTLQAVSQDIMLERKFMHICFLCNEYPPYPHGGIGVFTKTMSEALIDRNHKVTVIGTYPREWVMNSQDNKVNIICLPRSKGKLGMFIEFLQLRRRVLSVHKDSPIDVIDGPEFSFIAFPNKYSFVKLIRMNGGHHFFSITLGKKPKQLRGWLEKRSFANADFICGVSRFVNETTAKLLKFDPEHVSVLPNPVNTSLFSPNLDIPEQEGLIVFIGTLVKKKGVFELIRAFSDVLQTLPNVKLWMVGRDHCDPESGMSTLSLLKQVTPSDVLQHVQFKGPVDHQNLPEILAKAQVCVFPSHMEAQGIVIIEAMSMEKAIVASSTGPIPEMITDNETGLLCDPFDPASISKALITVLRDNELRKKLAYNARQKALQEFSQNILVQRNEVFYYDIINKFRSK